MLNIWLNIENNCSMKKIKNQGMSCNSLLIPAADANGSGSDNKLTMFCFYFQNSRTMSERSVVVVRELQPTCEIRCCHGSWDSLCWDRIKGQFAVMGGRCGSWWSLLASFSLTAGCMRGSRVGDRGSRPPLVTHKNIGFF